MTITGRGRRVLARLPLARLPLARFAVAAFAVAAGLAALIAPGAAPAQAQPEAPQPGERTVVSRGHVDLGPRFADGAWTMQVRDDTAQPAAWRATDDVVLHVRDTARLTMPDDPAYAFVGEKPGSEVHVVPQTEAPGVVWVGWNSQDPEVVAQVKRQIAFTLVGVEGPGNLLMYLQSGNLTAPQVLWDSRKGGLQDVFMDANVHTHANWLFTRPGTYLVTAEFSAELRDGRTVTDRRVLRFAVGDAADAYSAFAAVPAVAAETPGGAEAGRAAPERQEAIFGLPKDVALAVGIALAALALIVVAVLVAGGIARSRRAKALAAAELAGRLPGDAADAGRPGRRT